MEGAHSDAEVIARSVTEPARFEEIFDRHAGRVHRYLERRAGRQAADDLLGEVFRRAFESRGSYRVGAPTAGPWLYGIAGNVLFKRRRSEARFRSAVARLAGQERAGSTDAAIDGAADRLDARAFSRPVLTALAALSAGDREALLLHVWEELTYDEVADALRIPVGTVRSRLNRARRLVRQSLEAAGQIAETSPSSLLEEGA